MPAHRAGGSKSEAAASSPALSSADGGIGALRTSVLSPEPAYKSVLSRLAGLGLGSSAYGAQLVAQVGPGAVLAGSVA